MAIIIEKNKNNRFLAAGCLTVCIAIILAGLWPFEFHPQNKVEWLRDGNGIHFYGQGIVFSPQPLKFKRSPLDDSSISIEIVIQPQEESGNSGSILAVYDEKQRSEKFMLGQWKSHLIFRIFRKEPRYHYGYEEIGFDKMQVNTIHLVTITFGQQGVRLFLDGVPVPRSSQIKDLITPDNFGHLILGNSATGKNPWKGNILGLAIYDHIFPDNQASQQAEAWLKTGRPPLSEKPIVLYQFDEHAGILINNQSSSENHLSMPAIFQSLKKSVLVMPSRHYQKTWSFIWDDVINILGFMPFGFLFSVYLRGKTGKSVYNVLFITVLVGGTISLFIELIQVYLPSRHSSLIDLVTNIIGTSLGAGLSQYIFYYYHKLKNIEG